MNPVFSGELLIDLEIRNDCIYDTVDIVQTVDNTYYIIGKDGIVWFTPQWSITRTINPGP